MRLQGSKMLIGQNYKLYTLQFRHLIPAPVDRTYGSAWLYNTHGSHAKEIGQAHQWPIYLANQSYDELWGHPRPGNLVETWRALMYYARAAHTFSGVEFFKAGLDS